MQRIIFKLVERLIPPFIFSNGPSKVSNCNIVTSYDTNSFIGIIIAFKWIARKYVCYFR